VEPPIAYFSKMRRAASVAGTVRTPGPAPADVATPEVTKTVMGSPLSADGGAAGLALLVAS
jgi:hypothetical protein